MAFAPSRTGLGNGNGALTARVLPSPVVTVAIGPEPPPENVSPVEATAGLTVPSAFARSVGSRSAQTPARLTRTASALSVLVRVPSRLASVLDASVVRASTTTGLPLDLASARASSTACCSTVRAGAGPWGTNGRTPADGPWVDAVSPLAAGAPIAVRARAVLRARPASRAAVRALRAGGTPI